MCNFCSCVLFPTKSCHKPRHHATTTRQAKSRSPAPRLISGKRRSKQKNQTMTSERPEKKIKTIKDAKVSNGSSSSGGSHLTPELIARVTTFADAVGSPDVMTMCLAVGPGTSRTIRYYYLKRNVKFLERTIKCFCRKDIGREKACSNHLAWMKVNDDWRTKAVQDDLMDELKLACIKRESDHVQLFVAHPFIAFNNPVVAIEFGLFDSLKYLVEDKGIGINSFEWTAYGNVEGRNAERFHLLYYAFENSREEIFKYLFNRPDFNLQSKCSENDRTFPLFIYLLTRTGRFARSCVTMFMKHPKFNINGQNMNFFYSFLARRGEEKTLITPLYATIELLLISLMTDEFHKKKFRLAYHGAQRLLSAGADPNLNFRNFMSPITYVKSIKEDVQNGNIGRRSAENYKANERHWDEAVALLEKYA